MNASAALTAAAESGIDRFPRSPRIPSRQLEGRALQAVAKAVPPRVERRHKGIDMTV